MLALKILTYALVCCGFSGFASLKLHLFIHSLYQLKFWDTISCYISALILLIYSIAAFNDKPFFCIRRCRA